jgi:hypothetical protein
MIIKQNVITFFFSLHAFCLSFFVSANTNVLIHNPNELNMNKLIIILISFAIFVIFGPPNGYAGPFGLSAEILDPKIPLLIGSGLVGIILIGRKPNK